MAIFKTKWRKIRAKDNIKRLKGMMQILKALYEKTDAGEEIYIGKYLVVKHYTADGKEYLEIYEKVYDKKGVEGWNELALVKWDPIKDTWEYTNKNLSSSWHNKYRILWGKEKDWIREEYFKEVNP